MTAKGLPAQLADIDGEAEPDPDIGGATVTHDPMQSRQTGMSDLLDATLNCSQIVILDGETDRGAHKE
jgi:hypothetical protein